MRGFLKQSTTKLYNLTNNFLDFVKQAAKLPLPKYFHTMSEALNRAKDNKHRRPDLMEFETPVKFKGGWLLAHPFNNTFIDGANKIWEKSVIEEAEKVSFI